MNQSDPKFRQSVRTLLVIYMLFGLAQASGEYRVLFLESQGLSATECGYVLASASLLAAAARPLAGVLADKLRSRRIVYIGSVLFWIALLALLLLTRQVRLATFALCAGIIPFLNIGDQVTYGMIEASGVNAAMTCSGLDFSFIRVCLSIGYSAVNFLYTPLVKRFGPIAPFACTVVYLVVLLMLSGTLRRFESDSLAGTTAASTRKKLGLARLFRNYYLVTFVLLYLIISLGNQTASYIIFLLDELEMDAALVGMAAGVRVAGEIIIMPLVPRLKRKLSLPLLQAVAGSLCITQMVLYLSCRNPVVVMGAIMFGGFSSGITLSTTAVYLRLMAPKGLDTTTLSLTTFMSCLGMVLINLVGGRTVDLFGIYALYRLALVCLCLWLVLYLGTWALGKYVFKQIPPIPMFPSLKKR